LKTAGRKNAVFRRFLAFSHFVQSSPRDNAENGFTGKKGGCADSAA
jgi:hypothetical protein